ncbi:MAG: tetratricopeptide repeat protein [Nitrospirae bacterium]|nr:tetratricopeptide repeat protein [Nitrospirota bacterium]
MRFVGAMFILVLLLWMPACSSPQKAKPREPLAVRPSVPPAVAQYTLLGTGEYQKGDFEGAKTHFQQALAGAPNSAEAHYNLGLALFALGATEEAREHFIEAANLAPGDKVIWDSPALRPFGSPEPTITKKTKEPEYSTQRPTFGGGPRR